MNKLVLVLTAALAAPALAADFDGRGGAAFSPASFGPVPSAPQGRPGPLPGRRYTEAERRVGERTGRWHRVEPVGLEENLYRHAEALYIRYRADSWDWAKLRDPKARDAARASREAALKALRALREKARAFQNEVERSRDWPKTKLRKLDELRDARRALELASAAAHGYRTNAEVLALHGEAVRLGGRIEAVHRDALEKAAAKK